MFGTRKPLREMVAELRELRLEHERERLAFAEELREMRRERGQHIAEFHQLIEEHRQFTRECIARMERAEAREAKRIDDLLDESRAQRQALLRMIDRLGPAPGAAGA